MIECQMFRILPRRCNCTGGDSVWKQHIINGSVRQCYGQRNSCKVLNVTCPGNSACSSNGPGFSQCLCKPSWHGYKCLVKSGFPWLLIFAPVGGSTVVLIVVILLIQRRSVTPESHIKVTRMKEMITNGKKLLIVEQILLFGTLENV
ncbi:hypothetical protein pdam_00006609 [Pocillopora damicornis]|uniref:EGF-like domain-containing protein n=1 Tax=Pocillopora damicornis TaxID=46731 RepID=A0A3M6T8Q6_POCDA|nr:hypothetical protein pdam_00006609 [Pocillopora damicornis]